MIIQEEVVIPELSGKKPRRLFIYLPEEEYDLAEEEAEAEVDADADSDAEAEEEAEGAASEESEEETESRYPVLYMFDGHNVFFDETATYGTCWGMKEYLEEHKVPLIVAALECNHEGDRRLEEYSPYVGAIKPDLIRKADGKKTMDWFVHVLKPAMDEFFPTLPDREYTAIAGSSMGGLMALYAGTVYNEVFSKAACLSPCVQVNFEALMEDIYSTHLGEDTRIYMDIGSKEEDYSEDYLCMLGEVEAALMEEGAATCLRIVAGGDHSEASWSRQIPIFLRHLGLEE